MATIYKRRCAGCGYVGHNTEWVMESIPGTKSDYREVCPKCRGSTFTIAD